MAKQLQDLEAALALAPAEAPTQTENPLTIIQQKMQDIMEDLQANEHITPQQLEDAATHSKSLIEGFSATFRFAKEAQEQAAPKRIVGKKPPKENTPLAAPTQPAPHTRYHSK